MTRWQRFVTCAVLVLGAVLTQGCSPAPENVATNAAALTVPGTFIDEAFVTGISGGTAMEFAPDGRLFVAEKTGKMRVVKNGALLATPFFTVTVDSVGERGLLGIAFDPSFNSNHFVYTYYTSTSGSTHNRISRFTANGDVAVAGSEVVLMDLETLSSATNHNGGAVHFGTDGKLYVAVGNNANNATSQSLGSRLGKMLRLNSDGSIPTDNPFFNQTTGANRSIWAQGLRNPFTFAVQPGTGKIYINDVGEGSWEEIDPGIAGANYGWPDSEGNNNLKANETGPIYTYAHAGGTCAITGGTFYNPSTVQFPSSWIGHYFFADYCAGWIKRFDPVAKTVTDFGSGANNIVDLKVSPDGALYYLERGASKVGRVRSGANQPPHVDVQPMSQTIAVGQPVTFSVSASGTMPLAYQWQRNGGNIGGATSSSYTIASTTTADSGAQFRVIVSNSVGSATSNAATLTVVSNQPPSGTITAPTNGSLFSGGQTISYAGSATDPEDGALPASAFSWTMVFHHDTHTHPFLGPINGVKSGTFTIPNRGETSTNIWYRIHLTVTDSFGFTHASFVDINPRTANLSFGTSPAGLQVTLDGQPVTTPATVASVVGMIRTVGAVSPQTQGSTSYVFASWSDGGAASHDITTPTANTSYTATYVPGTAAGLKGEYYDNADLTSLKITRTDPTVNFDWGSGTPDPSIAADTYSVRWTGTVTPLFSQTYTFYARTNDGVRLWIDNQMLIDHWVNQGATETSGAIALIAGQAYAIKMEYYQNTNTALAQLSWSSASQAKQIIPQSQLSPGGAAPPPPTFPIKVNFQPAAAVAPSGYLVDGGDVYAAHGALSYGWNVSHTGLTRERNVNADQRVDTLCHFHAGGKWEVAVPNGTYNVLVSIGDPSFASTHTLNVEGTSYWSAVALTPNQFLSATKSITVSDGRITIDEGAAGEMATRIDYVEISQ